MCSIRRLNMSLCDVTTVAQQIPNITATVRMMDMDKLWVIREFVSATRTPILLPLLLFVKPIKRQPVILLQVATFDVVRISQLASFPKFSLPSRLILTHAFGCLLVTLHGIDHLLSQF